MQLPGLKFQLGEDIDALRETVHDFAQAEIAPRAAEIDRSDQFPMDLWRKLGDLGVLGITVDEDYGGARNFGHLAFEVEDIYASCERLAASGVTINRPPRDGRMAFVRSPDAISIELLQRGGALAVREPWASMPNVGSW